MAINSRRFTLFALIICSFAVTSTLKSAAATRTAELVEQKTPTENLQEILTSNKNAVLNDLSDLLNQKSSFTEEELLKIADAAIEELSFSDEEGKYATYKSLKTFVRKTLAQLNNYRITGVSFAHHLAGAFLYASHNYPISVTFKNNKGEIASQSLKLNYSSLGVHAELAYRFDAIFFVNANISRETCLKTLNLGTGLALGIGFAPMPVMTGVTILPLKDQAGSIIIAHFGIGYGGGLSLALGGGSINSPYVKK